MAAFSRALLGLVVVLSIAGYGLGCGGSSPPSGPTVPTGHAPLQQEPASVVGGFSIDLGDPAIGGGVVMQPGDEKFPCFIFPLALTGTSHVVGGGKLTSSNGMHHGNITTRPSTGTGIRPCPADPNNSAIGGEAFDILAGGAVLFASTTQIKSDEWESFPPGMGFKIKDGYEIVAHMHYLNTTGAVTTVAPKYEWFTIDESTLTQQIYPFIWQLSNWQIPPHTQQTFVGACRFQQPMHVVNALAHMHQLGTGLDVAFLGGPLDKKQWFTTPGYDPNASLQLQYLPAVDLSQGQATSENGMTMSCAWNNVTDQTIIEGTGINEMCMVFGYAYPGESAYSAKMSPGGDPRYCAAVPAPTN